MIEINGLNKYYGNNHVLRDIDLDIKAPGIYAILGPNGSGKTTLLKSILGLVNPRQGEIHVNGVNVSDTHGYRKEISYLPQIARFPDNLRVSELIRLIKDIRNEDADESELVELLQVESELKKGTRFKIIIPLN